MHKLFNWSARRSGGAMTIVGRDPAANGGRVTMTGVRKIEARGKDVVAVDERGGEHLLALEGAKAKADKAD